MDTTYSTLAALCLFGIVIRTTYEVLRRAGKIDSKNRAIFVVVFVGMCAVLGTWPAMCPRDP